MKNEILEENKNEEENTNQAFEKEVDEEKEKELKLLNDIKAARLRQQAAFNAGAAKYLEEKKLKDEEKAKEKIKEWDLQQQGMNYHGKTKINNYSDDLATLGLSPRTKLTSKLRLKEDDYNPLTGQSSNSDSGTSYRPSNRKSNNNKGG